MANAGKLEDLIDIELYDLYQKELDPNERISKATLKCQTIDPELSDFLKLNDIEEAPKPWNINSFRQIGMTDPFPDENKYEEEYPLTIPTSINHLVYDDLRYYPQHSVP